MIEQRKFSQACASLPKCYDIDNRENMMIHGTNRDRLSPHAVFIFPYGVERLVDVCMCVNLPV